uniref:DUF1622 domain-containing protein n=2 Tax=Ascaris TaxID=6251 RepID=A0A0M3HYE5_ASCLU
MEDQALVEVALGSTAIFAFVAYTMQRRSALINIVFLVVVVAAFCVFTVRSNKSLLDIPAILFLRVFDGSDHR